MDQFMLCEVRRQFEEYNLLAKKAGPIGKPDYTSCVQISTEASLWEMIIPGTLAVCAPLICGFFLGAEALGGMLVGGITSGFMLAVYMANGKGFAIGSAVLTSLALLTAYKTDTELTEIDVTKSAVLSAAILGACLPYIFAALTMMAVGRSATRMIGEVH